MQAVLDLTATLRADGLSLQSTKRLVDAVDEALQSSVVSPDVMDTNDPIPATVADALSTLDSLAREAQHYDPLIASGSASDMHWIAALLRAKARMQYDAVTHLQVALNTSVAVSNVHEVIGRIAAAQEVFLETTRVLGQRRIELYTTPVLGAPVSTPEKPRPRALLETLLWYAQKLGDDSVQALSPQATSWLFLVFHTLLKMLGQVHDYVRNKSLYEAQRAKIGSKVVQFVQQLRKQVFSPKGYDVTTHEERVEPLLKGVRLLREQYEAQKEGDPSEWNDDEGDDEDDDDVWDPPTPPNRFTDMRVMLLPEAEAGFDEAERLGARLSNTAEEFTEANYKRLIHLLRKIQRIGRRTRKRHQLLAGK